MVARKRSFGGIKACRIHDLLRVLCLKKAKEDNFFVQIYGDDSFSACATTKHRRLFIGCESFYKYQSFYKYSRPQDRDLHSILCPVLPKFLPLQNLSFFVENFKLLRVLSVISGEYVGGIGIGHPLHLRYLAFMLPDLLKRGKRDFHILGNNRYNASPLSNLLCNAPPLSNLLNLETLNLQVRRAWQKIPLPRDMFKMVKLRHLYSRRGVFQHHFSHLSYEERVRICSDRSSKLDSLQTLHRICSCKDCRSFLVRTPNLRKLGFYRELISHAGVLMLPDLVFLKCLYTLSFTHMKTLYTRERVPSTLPAGMKFPLSVTRLTLKDTLLKWEELSLLQTLPGLEVLKLSDNACWGPVWNTSELEGFPKLKYLKFDCLDIEEWYASEDQFPELEVLVLGRCNKLERIPNGFGNLNELREIKLVYCRRSVEESAKEIQQEQKNRKGDDDCLNLLAEYR